MIILQSTNNNVSLRGNETSSHSFVRSVLTMIAAASTKLLLPSTSRRIATTAGYCMLSSAIVLLTTTTTTPTCKAAAFSTNAMSIPKRLQPPRENIEALWKNGDGGGMMTPLSWTSGDKNKVQTSDPISVTDMLAQHCKPKGGTVAFVVRRPG